MSEFTFIADLCESHLIPSRGSLKHWKRRKLAELCYLYFLALTILLAESGTRKWARAYCKHAGEPNDFQTWRTDGNDLYAMLYGVGDESDDKSDLPITASVIRHWLRHVSSDHDAEDTHRFLMRIDGMFRITASPLKSLRRLIAGWDTVDQTERCDVVSKLIRAIHDRAPSNSELLPHLKTLAKEMHESASPGATGAASVATVNGGLGAGFAPHEGWRSIYARRPVAETDDAETEDDL